MKASSPHYSDDQFPSILPALLRLLFAGRYYIESVIDYSEWRSIEYLALIGLPSLCSIYRRHMDTGRIVLAEIM
jgi:hypothetical protein